MTEQFEQRNRLISENGELTQGVLNRIALEISHAPPTDRGTIVTAEFGWFYIPNQPLFSIKSHDSDMSLPLMRNGAFIAEPLSVRGATSFIHNHYTGHMTPSIEDVMTFFSLAHKNQKLTSALIASTNTGQVAGFYELRYVGKHSEVHHHTQEIEHFYRMKIAEKWEWLHKHPKILESMEPGQPIFNLEEGTQLGQDAMNLSSVIGIAHPFDGYTFSNWRFVKNTE
jgi:hypothetical protein